MINAELFRNVELGDCAVNVRLLYIGMIVNADDEGRMRAHPKYLRAAIFPFDLIEDAEILKMRKVLVEHNLISVYGIDGVEYLQHPKWEKWQILRKDRVRPSDCPPAPGAIATLYPWINETIIEGALDKRSRIVPFWLKKKILLRDKFTCRYCAVSQYEERTIVLAIDHVVPFSAGGKTEEENLVTSCTSCNCSKKERTLDIAQMALLPIVDAVICPPIAATRLPDDGIIQPKLTEPNPTKPNDALPPFGSLFEKIWAKYPKRDGKKAAERHFRASVKTAEDWFDIQRALDNYLKCETVRKGFIKNGSTWFNNWQDWTHYTEDTHGTHERKSVYFSDDHKGGAVRHSEHHSGLRKTPPSARALLDRLGIKPLPLADRGEEPSK